MMYDVMAGLHCVYYSSRSDYAWVEPLAPALPAAPPWRQFVCPVGEVVRVAASANSSTSKRRQMRPASCVVYPPLSPEEIGASLRDVQLYYIGRKDTGGILVAGEGDGGWGWGTWQRQQPMTKRQKACYFFLEQEAAQTNLEQVVRGDNSHDDGGRQGQTRSLQKIDGKT